jgi:hypothetical protein
MDRPFLFVEVTNPTWLVYVGLLVIAVYFRFTRFLTIRNLDITLLLLLSTAIVISVDFRDRTIPASAAIETTTGSVTEEESLRANSAASQSSENDTEGSPAVRQATAIVQATAEENAEVESADLGDKASLGKQEPHPAYRWASMSLLILSLMLLVRLVLDESLTRRPRLEQNLNQAGLTFLCFPAFAILMMSVMILNPRGSTIKAMDHGKALLERRDVPVDPRNDAGENPAPTETLIAAGGTAVAELSGTLSSVRDNSPASDAARTWLARILVVIAHTTVVAGLVTIGRQHFGSLQLGLSMSCLYLLLPCTAVNVHELSQVLPAACLIWAFASYRNPVVAGVLLGLASGTLFFAAFLLPLWAVFYGRRGALRFVVSVLGVTLVLMTSLMLISGDTDSFVNKLASTANWTVYRLLDDSLAARDTSFGQLFVRIPMAAVFFVMLTAMTVLPRPRNLENLLANSTSLVVAAQMWYPDDIGAYVLWYLPLFLLVIFRPRLDRFVPPEISERQHAGTVLPVSSVPSSTVATARMSLFSRMP